MKAKDQEQIIIIKRIICIILCLLPFVSFGQNNDRCIKLKIRNKDTLEIPVPVDVMLMNSIFKEASIVSNQDTLFIIIDSVTHIFRGDVCIQKIKEPPMCKVLKPNKKVIIKLYSKTISNAYDFICLKYGNHIYYFSKKRKNTYSCYKYIIGECGNEKSG